MRNKIISVFAVISAIAIGAWALHKNSSGKALPNGAPEARASEAGVPPYFSDVTGVTVPKTLPPTAFSDPVARHGYEIAAQIPRVLMQMPCYCHCDVMGHKSLLDCYTGKHAASCGICLDSATLVYEEWKAGKQINKIRQDLIDRNQLND